MYWPEKKRYRTISSWLVTLLFSPMAENVKFYILENGLNSLFFVLQIMQETDQKHSKNLDEIKNLEQNLNSEKTNVRYCFSKDFRPKTSMKVYVFCFTD